MARRVLVSAFLALGLFGHPPHHPEHQRHATCFIPEGCPIKKPFLR